MKNDVEPYYLKRAEEVIDMLFDQGYFHEKVTRADMRAVEQLLGFYFQSGAKSAVRAAELTRKIRSMPSVQESPEGGSK